MSEPDSTAEAWVHPVFDIFILGNRSSGKTVLLSSLYQKLSSMDGVSNFFARCDDTIQHRELCESYDTLLDTEADWPAGTYQVEDYTMQCFHRMRGQSLPVFSIRFHEYPGGYVSSQTDGREFLETRAAACHSVTALIDGRKVLARLEGKEENPAHSLHKDLDSLVRVLQQCAGKPIHFVITKADLLEPGKYPLRRIVKELSTHRGFQDIIEQQREEGASCLVIPVSAVGPKFTALDPETGTVRKRGDGTIDPFNLDVLIGAVMSDGVMELSRAAAVDGFDADVMPDSKVAKFHKKHCRKLNYGQMLAPASSVLFGPFGMVGLIALFATSQHFLADKSRKFEDKVRELRGRIADRTSALESITHIQFLLLERFLRRYPEASIGARFDPAGTLAREPVSAQVTASELTVQVANVATATLAVGAVELASGAVAAEVDYSMDLTLPPQAEPEKNALLSNEFNSEDSENAEKKRNYPPILYQVIGLAFWISVLWFGYQWWNTKTEGISESDQYEKSCVAGDEENCRSLTESKVWLTTDPKDTTAETRAAIETACSVHNFAVPCTTIADWNLSGWGIEVNSDRALALYQKACRIGSSYGCWGAAQLTLADTREEGHERASEALYARARQHGEIECNRGVGMGCAVLGRLLFSTRGGARNEERAMNLLSATCDTARVGFACHSLGTALQQRLQESSARNWYRKGCDLGFAASCSSLGFLLKTGKGGLSDKVLAGAIYRRGCDLRDAVACFNLARLRERWQPDATLARQMFNRACDLGHAEACKEVRPIEKQNP
jgi:TPR repeat protein